MLRDYGIPAVLARSAATRADVLNAAADVGYPVALKTDRPDISHKSDVGGVRLGIADPAELAAAYADLSARLDPRVTVTEMASPGQELILGMARDPALGPLIVVGAGGVLAEHLAERAVALPPLTSDAAGRLLDGLRIAELLKGVRGRPACRPRRDNRRDRRLLHPGSRPWGAIDRFRGQSGDLLPGRCPRRRCPGNLVSR